MTHSDKWRVDPVENPYLVIPASHEIVALRSFQTVQEANTMVTRGIQRSPSALNSDVHLCVYELKAVYRPDGTITRPNPTLQSSPELTERVGQ